MALVPIATRFDGFVSDVSRDQIPQGFVYRMQDWIPNNGAPARKRGGWSYASAGLSDSWISGAGWHQNPGDATKDSLVVVTDKGNIYTLNSFSPTATGVNRGPTGDPNPLKHKPIYFLGKLMIFKPGGGVKVWDGSALSDGVANVKAGAAWGDFVVLADGVNVKWGTTATTVVTGATWTAPADVVAIATFPHLILLFGYTDTWGLFGDTPPPGGDEALHTVFHGKGCMDARSLTSIGERYYWANSSGIYSTNGQDFQNLTERPDGLGISRFWRSLVANFNLKDGWIAAGGQLYGNYLISVHNAAGTLLGTLIYDTARGTWFPFTNWGAACYAHRPDSAGSLGGLGTEELFWGRRSEARVISASPAWSPSSANSADGDGKSVLPQVELVYAQLSQGESRARRVFVTYDMRSTSGNPALQTQFITDTPDGIYVASTRALGKTTKRTRLPTDVRRVGLGVGLKLVQTSPSDDTSLFKVEVEFHPHGVTRRA